MKIIARIHTDFPTKFGIPRQSGLIDELRGFVVFEPDYGNPDAVRGLDAFSHIWLLWKFSETARDTWSPTVRPPRLGGNRRVGVFASRSPFRPNPIGLSSVKLERIEFSEESGLVLHVLGVDMMDGTPIYDIKPYIPYTDSHPQASGGFSDDVKAIKLEVDFPEELLCLIPAEKRKALIGVLSNDPRPRYQNDAERIYGFEYAGFEVKFSVKDSTLLVKAVE